MTTSTIGDPAIDVRLIHGDCREVLATLAPASVDAVVTDPPYELPGGFMGKAWDRTGVSFDPETWRAVLHVLKPGGHLLAFSGTRTYHRMAVAIEDAGFEIRDMVAWLYASGFPKNLDVSKAIDRAAGAEREIVGVSSVTGARAGSSFDDGCKGTRRTFQNAQKVVNYLTSPATDDARQWQGWGTALKPALEPICLARKPLGGTVAANVLEHGTGALNVGGCRVEGPKPDTTRGAGGQNGRYRPLGAQGRIMDDGLGRWPANLAHDGSDEVLEAFARYCGPDPRDNPARFFFTGKATRQDREDGLAGLPPAGLTSDGYGSIQTPKLDRSAPRENWTPRARRNDHPTVKPTDLMRWLCRLVTPPGGVVLDPFMGSGSTGRAAVMEGFGFVGIDDDEKSVAMARRRVDAARLPMFDAPIAHPTPRPRPPAQPGLFPGDEEPG